MIGRQRVDVPSIQINNRALMLRVVEYLISLGYQRIGFIGGPEESITTEDRYRGFLDGIEKHNCLYSNEYSLFGDLTLESGYKMATQLLSYQQVPEAIVTANDQIAFGTIKAIKDRGLNVPKDIAVTGFDNTPLTRYFEPTVTTINIPRREMGQDAMQNLHRLINGEAITPITMYECQLIVRESTKPVS